MEDFKSYYSIISSMFKTDNKFEQALDEVWKLE